MHEFQDGEEARVVLHGIEVEVVVFRQCGELVYVFDQKNHAYQFHVKNLKPAKQCRAATVSTAYASDRRSEQNSTAAS